MPNMLDLKNSKIKRFIIVVMMVFTLSFIFTLIDAYPTDNSIYDLAYSTGQMFGNLFKILGTLAFAALFSKYYNMIHEK